MFSYSDLMWGSQLDQQMTVRVWGPKIDEIMVEVLKSKKSFYPSIWMSWFQNCIFVSSVGRKIAEDASVFLS